MDRLDSMQAFAAVADARSFSAAARKLRRSPAMVTRLVASLERHLGLPLLQRTTRSVALTEPGRQYLEQARRILADVAEADAAARAVRAAPSGRLAVTGPALFGRLHLAPLMCEFLLRYPEVRGELLLADRVLSLVDEGVDLAVRIGHLADSALVARKVGETARVLVASPRYLALRGTPREPAQLPRHALIHFTGMNPVPEWRFGGSGPERVVRFEAALTTNSGDAALGHAFLGGGITLALFYQVAQAVKAGQLVLLLRDFEPPPLPIQVVAPSARRLSSTARAFLELAARQPWRFTGPEPAAA
jgi:DNA-binding transcriptional LysR family regulator